MKDSYGTRKARPPIDIVTVVHEGDILPLWLQARALRMFFQNDDIGRIFVIVNELSPDGVYHALAKEVLEEYGALNDKVEIIPYTRLIRPHIDVSGRRIEQTLRLAISRIVTTENYLVLDAKSHPARNIYFKSFVNTQSGKLRIARSHNIKKIDGSLSAALSYFGVEVGGYSIPKAIPYLLKTEVVRSLIDHIEKREGAFFDDFMIANGLRISEFHLYFAYLLTLEGGTEQFYRFGPKTIVSAGRGAGHDVSLDDLERLDDENTFFVNLHPDPAAGLPVAAAARIASFWTEQGIFANGDEARSYLDRLRSRAGSGTMQSL